MPFLQFSFDALYWRNAPAMDYTVNDKHLPEQRVAARDSVCFPCLTTH